MNEVWKTVIMDGVEHPRYQVSNLGRVKCLNWHKSGKTKILPQFDNGYGYLTVMIDGETKYVHRIVAEAFHDNTNKYNCVDHIDGNRKNNSYLNLRFCNHKINNNNPITKKRYSEKAKWLGKFGAEHNRSIPIVQLSLDGLLINKWSCAAEAERELHINARRISECCRQKRKSAGGFRWMYYDDWLKVCKKRIEDIKPLF